jgi:hypothetical protein
MINIAPLQNVQHISLAEFVRVTTTIAGVATVYRFSTAPRSMTITAVDASPFDGLGALVKVGEVQRDIKSTANETTITLVGIDTSLLGWVLGQAIKGAKIEVWRGFFDDNGVLITTGGTGGLYKSFTGIINTFSITEQWMEAARSFVGAITVSAANIQIILQNRIAGRYTNDNSWQFYNAGDTSMNRVNFISNVTYQFGLGSSGS